MRIYSILHGVSDYARAWCLAGASSAHAAIGRGISLQGGRRSHTKDAVYIRLEPDKDGTRFYPFSSFVPFNGGKPQLEIWLHSHQNVNILNVF